MQKREKRLREEGVGRTKGKRGEEMTVIRKEREKVAARPRSPRCVSAACARWGARVFRMDAPAKGFRQMRDSE